MRKTSVISFFALLFIASASSFPFRMNEDSIEDIVPPSASNFRPYATPTASLKTTGTAIKDQDNRGIRGSRLELVDNDFDNEVDDYVDNEELEEDLAPPSSSNSKKTTLSMTFKPNMYHADIKCYDKCAGDTPIYCYGPTTKKNNLSNSQKNTCSSKCRAVFC